MKKLATRPCKPIPHKSINIIKNTSIEAFKKQELDLMKQSL